MLAEYVAAQGFTLKKKSTKEWCMPCPLCGGRDRMLIFADGGRDNGGRYYCRQCKRSGDTISWKIDIEGKRFSDVGKPSVSKRVKLKIHGKTREHADGFNMDIFRPWAKRIAERAEHYAQEREGHDFYAKRGIDKETVRELHLGWIPAGSFFFPAEQTGRRDGGKTCTPHGACLPVCNAAGDIDCLLIRRAERSQWDKYGKWYQIGKQDVPFLLGEKGMPLVVCESILDACSVWQASEGLRGAAALLGADKRPDARLTEYMKAASKVLVCADSDEGGKALCTMVLGIRPDAKVWRPKAEGVKDLNDVLVKLGNDGLCLFIDRGLALAIKDDEVF